jgi:hypothetical protein
MRLPGIMLRVGQVVPGCLDSAFAWSAQKTGQNTHLHAFRKAVWG